MSKQTHFSENKIPFALSRTRDQCLTLRTQAAVFETTAEPGWEMGQRKVKVLWSFPAVLTLPFFVCLFQCLPVCYNPLIILEFWKIRFWQFLLIFSIFPQRDWPLELPNFFFFADLSLEREICFDYVEFVVPMGRLSIHVPLIGIGVWIFPS